MSFLVSTTRNARLLADRLALGLGLVLGPCWSGAQVGLDLLWTGIVAGIGGLWRSPPARGAAMSAHVRAVGLSCAGAGRLPADRGLAHARPGGRRAASTRNRSCWSGCARSRLRCSPVSSPSSSSSPPGALAAVPLAVRLAAIACGFAAFLLVRRSVLAGVAAGETVLVVGAMLVGR